MAWEIVSATAFVPPGVPFSADWALEIEDLRAPGEGLASLPADPAEPADPADAAAATDAAAPSDPAAPDPLPPSIWRDTLSVWRDKSAISEELAAIGTGQGPATASATVCR